MKYSQIKEMSDENLVEKLRELEKEVSILNHTRVTGATEKNVKKIRDTKKDVARIKTCLNEKKGN
ncbi:MAG: 50S ribosomal protein L29 [Candidatus Nanoarchaeia archaeon]|nr:50S ribosomal protein L29 [Candidatus Nanoarchaeia archaeon]